MKTIPVIVSRAQIDQTIGLLRQAGHQECVLLWLGQRDASSQRIEEVFLPLQERQFDYFVISRPGMAELMARLRTKGLYVVSQIHTHPGEAFHSPTDDKWAIVRHVGALSIVLPCFAMSTTLDNFLQQAAVFHLSASNAWKPVKPRQLSRRLIIIP